MNEILTRNYMTGDILLGAPYNESFPLSGLDEVILASPSYTVLVDGDVALIMWLTLGLHGIAAVRVHVNRHIRRNPKGVSKALGALIPVCYISYNLRKVYALIGDSEKVSRKWAERYGFKEEYIMEESGPNQCDMIGYSLHVNKVLGTDY